MEELIFPSVGFGYRKGNPKSVLRDIERRLPPRAYCNDRQRLGFGLPGLILYYFFYVSHLGMALGQNSRFYRILPAGGIQVFNFFCRYKMRPTPHRVPGTFNSLTIFDLVSSEIISQNWFRPDSNSQKL
jgi:hypothetical protein